MSLTDQSLAFSGIFEAEVLLELMLRYWAHPFAEDEDFRNGLLEGAAGVLRSCVSGQRVIENIPPEHTSFISATWYVEWNALAAGEADPEGLRREWLEKVRKALPSCFCPPESLP